MHEKIQVDPRVHVTTKTGLLDNFMWVWQGVTS